MKIIIDVVTNTSIVIIIMFIIIIIIVCNYMTSGRAKRFMWSIYDLQGQRAR